MGSSGEAEARQMLETDGYQFVAANVECRYGEVDLIMRDGTCLVFVEVKTRRTVGQGVPQEAVTPRKVTHLTNTAQWYCQTHRLDTPWRIDVVAVGPSGIEHLQNVTGT